MKRSFWKGLLLALLAAAAAVITSGCVFRSVDELYALPALPKEYADLQVSIQKTIDELGAEYAVTQLFYDNRKYFEFVEQAKAAGINIPIIPGIKPFKKLSQLSMIPKTFKVDLPEDLVKEALKCKNDVEAEQVGIEWCVAQCKELMAHGVPSIHFYSIGAVDSIKEVAKIIY